MFAPPQDSCYLPLIALIAIPTAHGAMQLDEHQHQKSVKEGSKPRVSWVVRNKNKIIRGREQEQTRRHRKAIEKRLVNKRMPVL